MDSVMTKLERRILDISYKHKLSHIGSCLTAVDIIDKIYAKKKPDERFVLSCGHAGLALYVVLEKYGYGDAEELLEKCGVHPDRLAAKVIDCSTGSLGHGLPIALGMALADMDKNVYCLISDGECSEGSIYEALNVKVKYSINNLIVHTNVNGWSAYDKWYEHHLPGIEKNHNTSKHWFIKQYGQSAHYKVLNEQEYETINNCEKAIF